MPVIYLIRHAQASYGAIDYDVLSELGIRQTTVLDATLRRRCRTATQVAVSGPARRHRDTARLCKLTLGPMVPAEDERWAEYDTDMVLARYANVSSPLYGTADPPLSSNEFQVQLDSALEEWVHDGHQHPSPLVTWARYQSHVMDALHDLAAPLDHGQTALAFTSAGAIAAVCCALLELNPSSFVALNRVQVNTGITKVVAGRRGLSLVSFNDHGHLEEVDPFLVTSR